VKDKIVLGECVWMLGYKKDKFIKVVTILIGERGYIY